MKTLVQKSRAIQLDILKEAVLLWQESGQKAVGFGKSDFLRLAQRTGLSESMIRDYFPSTKTLSQAVSEMMYAEYEAGKTTDNVTTQHREEVSYVTEPDHRDPEQVEKDLNDENVSPKTSENQWTKGAAEDEEK